MEWRLERSGSHVSSGGAEDGDNVLPFDERRIVFAACLINAAKACRAKVQTGREIYGTIPFPALRHSRDTSPFQQLVVVTFGLK